MINILILILSISCLNSCRTTPKEFVGYQCSPVYAYEDIAGVTYINAELSKCFCRKYKVSTGMIGPISEAVNEPISKCNKIIGYSPKDYVDLANLMEYVRQQIPTKNKAKINSVNY
jgi:hypothetical protein